MQRFRAYLLPLLLVSLFVIAYSPALVSLIRKWSASEDYAHAFFTIPLIMYMVWQKKEILMAREGNNLAGLPLVIGSILLYILSTQLQIPTLMFLATVFTMVSMLIYFFGFNALRELTMPILLLFLVIPIPNQLFSMMTAALQLKVSQLSEITIHMFSIPLFREGNVLHIPNKTFQVVEACSGIRSLISLTTLSLLFGYFTLTKWRSIAVLFLVSIPIAILINIVRVVSMVVAYHFLEIDLTEGIAHTIAGLGLFLLGLILLGITQRILESWEIKKT